MLANGTSRATEEAEAEADNMAADMQVFLPISRTLNAELLRTECKGLQVPNDGTAMLLLKIRPNDSLECRNTDQVYFWYEVLSGAYLYVWWEKLILLLIFVGLILLLTATAHRQLMNLVGFASSQWDQHQDHVNSVSASAML